MKLRMVFKISSIRGRARKVAPAALAVAVAAAALAPFPAAAQVQPPASPPPAAPLPPPPPAGVPALPPAGAPGGPAMDLPPERDMPSTALPRETAIENPLGREPAVSGTAVGGYGELTLNAPSNAPAIVDMRRFVLFVGHNFSDRLRFYSEVEVEHAISSAED